ncbi:3-deoxy-manno-octulosonate cytidylyltransferase [Sporomusa acidovorans]|uniref:3-deoxy-manno-octulosonate cytidylyltransferase n=1 Tax=Sporomusa acidovorans (strain ATCC 49682 / DSM 3132 / Mol) TaxID=1123286 RepID=A0ABZ3J7U2_SPOA4|nr:3-deoxy-manno-octulosonate cytidylyltransferase [Sporomusa acidovorans]OZC19302.1 3-deoxy-manno-octulosonate cytidylyltransferase [Sporomusa acidovorans DSM 3132]SDD81368.1 3-deoxy-manno-octulosonate cytidylyltransferase (CMP-KDO synthetase) [Sporomusa acidovorans]
MNILCVIPARYSSTRLPGKPLALIAGKPMIERVYERALAAKRPTAVLVATDHELVYQAVRAFGGQAMMTSPGHATGTDRLAEVAEKYTNADIIINVQGDEPLIAPAVIDLLAGAFDHDPGLNMATLMTEMDKEEYNLPSVVKVVTSLDGYALYFSRSLIPYPRNSKLPGGPLPVYKHIGIYAYRRDFLLQYAAMAPTPLEATESLEQLRALEHGYKIKVLKTDFTSIGVDTPEDLEKVNEYFRRQNR